MDWERAIDINRAALIRIVAALIALVGLSARIHRPLHRAALRVLRPAESAVRRLIVIAARDIVVTLRAARPMPAGLAFAGAGGGMRFQLYDDRKRFGPARTSSTGPRLFISTASPLIPLFRPAPAAEPEPDGLVTAARLRCRLAAIKLALEDLGAQAVRQARWQARRGRMANPKFRTPLRPGLPPGHRAPPEDDVDWTLSECHALAQEALKEDSS